MKNKSCSELTLGARRTIKDFRCALFDLLTVRRFEKITVGEICQKAQYPRATFYNYFEDKYDLLNDSWKWTAEMVRLEGYPAPSSDKVLHIYFDRLYDLLKSHEDWIGRALSRNDRDGYLWMSYRSFFFQEVREMFKSCPEAEGKGIPSQMLADHYSNTILLVMEWCFLKKNRSSKDEAQRYLKVLLGNL